MRSIFHHKILQRVWQITDQNEWFAFDFVADIEWPKHMEGMYEFELASDDGSIFMIDDEVIINNDGHHGMIFKRTSKMMKAGKYKIRVLYFQGAATKLGLVFNYRAQGDLKFQPFYTKKFEQMRHSHFWFRDKWRGKFMHIL